MEVETVVFGGEHGPSQVRRNFRARNDDAPGIGGFLSLKEPLHGPCEYDGRRGGLYEVEWQREDDRRDGEERHRDEQDATHAAPGDGHSGRWRMADGRGETPPAGIPAAMHVTVVIVYHRAHFI